MVLRSVCVRVSQHTYLVEDGRGDLGVQKKRGARRVVLYHVAQLVTPGQRRLQKHARWCNGHVVADGQRTKGFKSGAQETGSLSTDDLTPTERQSHQPTSGSDAQASNVMMNVHDGNLLCDHTLHHQKTRSTVRFQHYLGQNLRASPITIHR